ncbi:MAG: cytochrome B5 [Caldilineae bacterium]|nr:cytochrome B5 [Caldilineae bacterium]
MNWFDPPEVAPVVREEQPVPDREFTEMELRQYNGERGRRAYIAYMGIVYDVTDAPNWRGGMHRDLHYSGLDLTRSLRKAPHSESVFQRVPAVGRLIEDGR